MRLHTRLALPLFAVSAGATAAGTLGALWLVRGAFALALDQSGGHLTRISENVLKAVRHSYYARCGSRDIGFDTYLFADRADLLRQIDFYLHDEEMNFSLVYESPELQKLRDRIARGPEGNRYYLLLRANWVSVTGYLDFIEIDLDRDTATPNSFEEWNC